jgi:hypothetical protein
VLQHNFIVVWGEQSATCHFPRFDVFLARGCGRQRKAWGAARQRGTPGTTGIYGASPRSGRQLFVIRHFIIN